MGDTIEFHNIVWYHTLEITKWNFLLGKTSDEVMRDNLNPFLSTDSEQQQQHIIDYTPFQFEEPEFQTNLNHVETDYNYEEYPDHLDEISSSDDDEDYDEYFEFD
jgi:hypothetical protein